MPIEFSRVIPTLRMFDIRKAREFYIDYLGFKVDFEHRFEPELRLFMGISSGGIQLYLSEHHGDGSPGTHVTVDTVGLAEYHAELGGQGLQLHAPGPREAALRHDHHDRVRSVLQPHHLQRSRQSIGVRMTDA